jgi:hypothetical protein
MNSMSPLLLVVLLAAATLMGCKRQAPAASSGGSDQSDAAPPSPRGPGPMPRSGAPAVVADTGDVNATLRQLSDELRKYVIRARSVPKNFEEFAAKSQTQFPPAPAGKKYVIKGQAVVLANQ